MSARRLTGRHVLAMIAGGFAVVLLANGALAYFAFTSFSGLSTEDAYRKGLAYNRTLEQAAAQRALGWRVEVTGSLEENGQARFEVRVRDQGGRAVDGLAVTGELRRPAVAAHDRTMVLGAVGAGRYGARLALPLRGQWDFHVTLEDRSGRRFRREQRLWLN